MYIYMSMIPCVRTNMDRWNRWHKIILSYSYCLMFPYCKIADCDVDIMYYEYNCNFHEIFDIYKSVQYQFFLWFVSSLWRYTFTNNTEQLKWYHHYIGKEKCFTTIGCSVAILRILYYYTFFIFHFGFLLFNINNLYISTIPCSTFHVFMLSKTNMVTLTTPFIISFINSSNYNYYHFRFSFLISLLFHCDIPSEYSYISNVKCDLLWMIPFFIIHCIIINHILIIQNTQSIQYYHFHNLKRIWSTFGFSKRDLKVNFPIPIETCLISKLSLLILDDSV